METNAQAFQTGVKQGNQAVADEEQRAADATQEAEKEASAASLKSATLKNDILQKQMETMGRANDESYKNIRGTLSGNITALQSALDARNLDSHSAGIVQQNLSTNQQLLGELDRTRGAVAANTQPGQPEQYDPKFYTAPGVPPNLALSPEAQQEAADKQAQAHLAVQKLQNEVTSGAPGAKGEKPAAVALSNLRSWNSSLQMLGSRGADLDAAQKYEDAQRTNPSADPEAPRLRMDAFRDYGKARDEVQAGWANVTQDLLDGSHGETNRALFDEIRRSVLPAWADPSDLQNHTAIAAEVNRRIQAILGKDPKSLTPAEKTMAVRLSGLGDIVKADVDLPSLLRSGKSAAQPNHPPQFAPQSGPPGAQ